MTEEAKLKAFIPQSQLLSLATQAAHGAKKKKKNQIYNPN
jgi:hypothetical protein